MRDQIITNLWVSSEQDAVGFWYSQQPHVSIDLTGWNIDVELNQKTLNTVSRVIPIIHSCLVAGIPCLVYCHGGIDRSPFMVACYLFEKVLLLPNQAYQAVKKAHPETIIHDDWMKMYIHLRDGSEE